MKCRLCKTREGSYETIDKRKMFFNKDGSTKVNLCQECLINFDNDEYVLKYVKQQLKGELKWT